MRMSSKRALVAFAVFASVVVGLVVHTGMGTPSALGWRDIALICPVGALEVLAGARGFLLHPLVLLLVATALAFVFGKAFCAWGCLVPHVRGFFRPKKKARRGAEALDGEAEALNAADSALEPVGGERDGVHVDSRHAVLAGAVASSFVFGFPVFCLVCPVGLSFAVVIGLWNLFRFNEASWGLLVFPAIIVLEVVFFRSWCTKFCPISALLSLVAAKSPALRPVVSKAACLRGKGVDCRTCVVSCPERVDPHSANIPECSRCGECAEKCPAQAIKFSLAVSKEGKGARPDSAPMESK